MSVSGGLTGHSEQQPAGRQSPEWDRPNMALRMVLVGKTGAGKSSSGNTIFGQKVFRDAKSGSSVTKECWKESREVAGREVTLVDTPGLFDPDLSEKEKQEISKCINMTAPGPHAIILVLQLGPFTREERLSVEKIRAIFGEEADRYTIVLFTHGDELTGTIEEFLSGENKDLKDLISRCGQRYHVFNNTRMQDRIQVVQLLEKVDKMVSANESEFYTSKMYQDVELTLKMEEEKLKKFYEQDLLEKERELELKFEEEKRKLQNTIDALNKSNQENEKQIQELKDLNIITLTEYKRYYEEKLRKVRQEAEQTTVTDQLITYIFEKLKICK